MYIYWLNFEQKFLNGTIYKPERKVLKSIYFLASMKSLKLQKTRYTIKLCFSFKLICLKKNNFLVPCFQQFHEALENEGMGGQ